MGQRSQIYVRYNGKLILARYYSWNYGERMISRVRYGLEYMKYEFDQGYTWIFGSEKDLEKMARFFDVNFDMKDIVMSTDIFKEYEEYGDGYSVFDYVFAGQDNNDGQAFIDMKDNDKEKTIKYAFTDGSGIYSEVMDARQYMEWNEGSDWEKPTEYRKKSAINTCNRNIKNIDKMASLMTVEELQEFVGTDDYFNKTIPF